MTSFLTFNPTVEQNEFLKVTEEVLNALNLSYKKINNRSYEANIKLSFFNFSGTLKIDFISKNFVNLTVNFPTQIADSGKGFEVIKEFIENYQKVLVNRE